MARATMTRLMLMLIILRFMLRCFLNLHQMWGIDFMRENILNKTPAFLHQIPDQANHRDFLPLIH